MIFITTGTTPFPFKRMSEIAQQLSQHLVDEEIIYQGNGSQVEASENMRVFAELDFDSFINTLKKSRLVITHGGPGSIFLALRNSPHKPIVIPRLAEFNEHVNDHQLYFFNYLKKKQYISSLPSKPSLASIKKYLAKPEKLIKIEKSLSNAQLVKRMKEIVADI